MEEPVPLSALQHWMVCPRQCGLIHLERLWAENQFTAEGRILHRQVDSGGVETRPGLKVARSLPLACNRLGLVGQADVVEFLPGGAKGSIPYPVEYKRGKPKGDDWDKVQLCGQALCLEEMLGVAVPEGALFYGGPRRREIVAFDAALRARTEAVAQAVQEMMRTGRTPPAIRCPACKGCSLRQECLPDAMKGRKVAEYLDRMLIEEEA